MDKRVFSMPQQFVLDGVVMPGRMVSPDSIANADSITPQPGDVLTVSYPRSGTTWLLETISLIQTGGDVSTANALSLSARIHFLESRTHRGRQVSSKPLPGFSGRIMRTHLQYKHIAKLVNDRRMKTIVTLRNPKDMLVSYYHFYQLNAVLGSFDGSWDEFFELFRNKQLAFGDWFDHISELWKNCSKLPNVLFVHYEEAKDNIHVHLRKLSAFLNQDLDASILGQIADHVSIQNMKKNPAANYADIVERGIFTKGDAFIRKGEVGEWKTYFTDEQSRYVDEQYIRYADDLGLKLKDTACSL